MSKNKTRYVCKECGTLALTWHGQCPSCQAWDSLSAAPTTERRVGYAGSLASAPQKLGAVRKEQLQRLPSHSKEFDRSLGGGMVEGSVVLLGGDPGIGKSTLLLQMAAHLSTQLPVVYISGEESLPQIRLRAERLRLPTDTLDALSETDVEQMLSCLESLQPKIVVVDSIQTLSCPNLGGPLGGGISQLREATARLVRYAKHHDCLLFLIGHVTKEGQLAGPKLLEHMVDTVLYFEGESQGRLRMLRAHKNRFGAAHETGFFAMTETGLRDIENPSAIFLEGRSEPTPGSVVLATWEGTRPVLVELQALVDSHPASGHPRRLCVGLDSQRVSMILAVLSRHAGLQVSQGDVFLNVVGGIKIEETASDLAVAVALVSSLRNRKIPKAMAMFGEIGLGGEIRPIAYGVERIKELKKHGFSTIILPKGNQKTSKESGLLGVESIKEALDVLFD